MPTPQPRITGTTQITNDGFASAGSAVGTDGVTIYFDRFDPVKGGGIAQVSINGGQSAEFSSPLKDAFVVQISPDHPKLLAVTDCTFGTGCSIWSLPLPAGSPRKLAKADAELAQWSPDEKLLGFGHGAEIWLAAQDGTILRKSSRSQRVTQIGSRFHLTAAEFVSLSWMGTLTHPQSGKPA